MVLLTSNYGAPYFGDLKESGGLRHEAGYSNYLDSVKEKPYLKRVECVFKKVSGGILELGCGTGTYAKIAREKGLDWMAVDVSPWCKKHEETPIIKSEALTYLKSQNDNSYDYIISFALIECFDNITLKKLKIEMDRVGKKQIHYTYKNPNPLYYNKSVKTIIKEVEYIG